MTGLELSAVAVLILVAAVLYSSVGHGGASGYLAVMGLVGVSVATMKPAALSLNILVASIAFVQFARHGGIDWRLLWPFVVLSIPAAFVGGWLEVPEATYQLIVGAALWLAALRLWNRPSGPASVRRTPPPIWAGLLIGAVIGFVAGLTGVGGGIFLSPLLLLLRWADARTTAGVSAAFIVVNSISGLIGHQINDPGLPVELVGWAPAAVIGGLVGATWGSRRLNHLALRRALSLVLVIAGGKMILL